jgi:hypothetical protein
MVITDIREHQVRRSLLAAVLAAVLAGAAVLVVASLTSSRAPSCPAPTDPLGRLGSPQQEPRLCQLGAPSKLIGSGRLDGVSWRIVVTPPRPWSAYRAAGFSGPAPIQGKNVSCIIEVDSSSRGASYGCQQWNIAHLAGKFVTSGCGSGPIVVCYCSVDARASRFVVVQAYGPELTARPTYFLGTSFTAFAMPAGEAVGLISAYDDHGRLVASTTP